MSLVQLEEFKAGRAAIPDIQYAWPLYGSGIDHLGKDGQPVKRDIPVCSSDQLLMRIDAVSLCYTDLKEIDLGNNHPRLEGRDLETNPIVPGHELSMTVVGVGSQLQDEYQIGQRFTLQPDVWVDGKSVPFCFGMDGAYRQYAVIDHRILNGDAGNYLIPVPEDMTYAVAAITEPWACVEASYRMKYRTALQEGGQVLFLGNSDSRSGFELDESWVAESKPESIYICDIPQDLHSSLSAICMRQDIKLIEITRADIESKEVAFEDILFLDGTADDLSFVENSLTKGTVIAFYNDKPLEKPIEIDMGRLHYDDLQYIGTVSKSLSGAYTKTPARPEFKPDGTAMILGAGGPMGRMHLQRAIESRTGPKTVITSNVTESRVKALKAFFGPLAEKYKKNLFVTNPRKHESEYLSVMNDILKNGGVDDIEVMVTLPKVIAEVCQFLATGGVVNVFAGMKRGVKMAIDSWMIIGEKQIRFIGHSGSALDDQKAVVDRCISGDLDTNLSVAAIGGLKQISEGVQAMRNSTYPGKIVIYPQVLDFPLTAVPELHTVLPVVAEKLGNNRTWNQAAEQAFLESELS